MQTYQLEVNDNISDKIFWLLSSFEGDVKIKKINSNNNKTLDEIVLSVKEALNEVENSNKNNIELNSAWDLVDEL